ELPVPKRQALADFRVGVWFDDPACRVGHDVGAVFRNAVDRIADAGAKIEEAHPPVDFEAQLAVFWHMIIAAVAPSLDPSIAEAAGGSHLAWLRAEEERAKLRAVWAEWFSEYDALLCPVSPRAAFPHDQTAEFLDRTVEIDGETRPYSDLLGWVGLIGIMALPSVAAPVGRTAENLPVGIQIVSPYLYERQSIRIAQLIQPIVGGYETPPGF
ncbi:MAG TPA: amidase family protein, partial [Acidimicrobiia bacterium]|nr:amidase family protein [Acidimicrobiia bacterium]